MRALRSLLSAASSALLVTAALAVPVTTASAATAPASPVAPVAPALENGLARTPPMGFNNWNSTHCRAEFNEAMVKGIADIFVTQGLKDVGYQYVNLDDCWALPQRDAQGNLVPDPVRFPNGIKAVADYVHSKGLKFGIYTSAGIKTCDTLGFPGALGHEQQDANLFASWGVDYLKYDNCNNQGVDARQRYRAMRDALAATGRPIVYSICEWGQNQPWLWAQDVGNLWRTTGDISDSWSSMIDKARRNRVLAQYARPGAWNDPDMLEVGNGGMTDTEYRTHFSLWAIMAAPLLIGSDLRRASASTFTTLKNKDVIDIDQDPLGMQGVLVKSSGGLSVYAKPLRNGDYAVALSNENTATATIGTTVAEIGMGGSSSYSLKDLWSKATRTTTGAISSSVPGHGTVLYRVTPDRLQPPPTGTTQLSDLSWTSAIGGWGPVERDMSNGETGAGDGTPLQIQGVTYAKGIGTHAVSDITYHLGGRCTRVVADVGVDDDKAANGSISFEIYRDGTKVADSGLMTVNEAARRLTADVTGGTALRLHVGDGGNGINSDWADWADAKVTCAGTGTTTRYEAEAATISQGTVDSDHPGFSGTGFVNYVNAAGSYVEWTVSAPSAGAATVTFRYANGTTADRPMDVTVNGNLVGDELSFPGTGTWTGWTDRAITVPLVAGANTLRATATAASGGPNVDYADVTTP
ncbi:NPCBM/NEW2 domain-containing protein [Streptosporangium sp. NPDC000396]|uniref:NPCBM/NEW2 domain-containing protein n=1 Tax=Streptosporangium sp. NPDC000396 TaxID=3366185 RepID=UPI0036A31519